MALSSEIDVYLALDEIDGVCPGSTILWKGRASRVVRVAYAAFPVLSLEHFETPPLLITRQQHQLRSHTAFQRNRGSGPHHTTCWLRRHRVFTPGLTAGNGSFKTTQESPARECARLRQPSHSHHQTSGVQADRIQDVVICQLAA